MKTAEDRMKRAMILIVIGIVVCAALAVMGFLRLWGVV